jgi:phosphoribosylaminoimidazolecarboxamide formyltransferase/IMP cyclohydrolase
MNYPDLNQIKRALISVSNKSELVDLAKFLISCNVEILSTGGTAKLLVDAGVKVEEVATYTGFPEILDGRVKTLNPKIHAGLLSRRDRVEDNKTLEKYNIQKIDLVIVNLYPFEQTVASGASYEDTIENIDIGGPAMIRSAAKNHNSVTVITDPTDYSHLTKEMIDHSGSTSIEFRKELAAKAYRRTASYDAAIGGWFNKTLQTPYPERLNFSGVLKQELRYGENPHQTAALYTNGDKRAGVANAVQLQGKELSFNNLNDTDAAFELVSEFKDIACVIVKHANPCGVSISANQKDAYLKAIECDPESAFGGIIALNKPLDKDTAKEIIKLFAEVIIAPKITKEAQKVLIEKKNLRVLEAGSLPIVNRSDTTIRTLAGGYLIQARDSILTEGDLNIVTKRSPSKNEMRDLLFAFTVCKHVKSNAIIYAKNNTTVGIGAGQMSRVNSSRIAAWKASDASSKAGENQSRAVGSVLASDAFFPFADGLIAAAEAGITAVIQPGGSIRDDELIVAADEKGLAMVFTGTRHFRH